MEAHGIPTNDLRALSHSFEGTYSKKGNVHYNKEGSKKWAEQVEKEIKNLLP